MATHVGGKKMAPKVPAQGKLQAQATGLRTGAKPAAAAPPKPAAPVQPEIPMDETTTETTGAERYAEGSECDLARQSLLWHARLVQKTIDLDDETIAAICREVAAELDGTADQ